MDNPEHQELTPIERELCNQKPKMVVKTNKGQLFTVHLGAPRESYAGQGVFTAPEVPHILVAQHFELSAPGQTLVETSNVNVLFMHGVTKGGRWYPRKQELQQQGLTVEDIVEGLVKTGQTIDAIFVCNPESTARVKIVPFSGQYQRPMIYMKNGDAKGSVTINDTTGEISVRMNVDSPEEIEFMKWKNRGRVRVVK